MSVVRIATRYAKSLLDLSIERGSLEPVNSDMATLRSALQNKDLALLLKSPIIQADKKISAIDAIFKGKLDELTLAYLHLLINKGREPYLADIATEFGNQYKILKKITAVKVTTAVPMTDEVLNSIKIKIQQSGIAMENLEIQSTVDPKLIGGFVLEFDNKRYDASVLHKLDQLKSEFSKNLYVKEF